MRIVLLVASLAAALTLTYILSRSDANHEAEWTPELGEDANQDRKSARMDAANPVRRPSATEVRLTRPVPSQRVKHKRLSQASKNRASRITTASRAKQALHDPKQSNAQKAGLEDLGLKPEAHDRAAKASRAQALATRRAQALANPMDGRWIGELSGPQGRMHMSVKERKAVCADAAAGCEREPAPDSISIAGVVVKAENVVATPERPVAGIVRAGHYLEKTPAVYVE